MIRVVASITLGLALALAPTLGLADQHERGRSADKSKAAEKAPDASQGAEMRERREERKEIQSTYREGVEAGEERVKGKKPWWKFWGDDEE